MGGGPFASLLGGGMGFTPQALQSKMKENVGSVRDMLMDHFAGQYDEDEYDEEEIDDKLMEGEGFIDQMMKGGLRLSPERLKEMRQNMPFLEDNDKVLDLIKTLYDNVQDTETGQRMSNAYDKLKKDRATVAMANLQRKRRGEAPIKDKLKDVLEPDD